MNPEASLGLRLKTPGPWMDLDLRPGSVGAAIQQVIAKREREKAPELTALLETAAQDATLRGGLFASLFSEALAGQAVSASLIVSVVDADSEIESALDSADEGALRLALVQGLTAELSGDGIDTQVRVLEAGPAARVRTRLPVDGSPRAPGTAHATEVDSLQYFVPFPDGNRLAVLSFSTPNVALADAFAEVFDAIAGTLRWQS